MRMHARVHTYKHTLFLIGGVWLCIVCKVVACLTGWRLAPVKLSMFPLYRQMLTVWQWKDTKSNRGWNCEDDNRVCCFCLDLTEDPGEYCTSSGCELNWFFIFLPLDLTVAITRHLCVNIMLTCKATYLLIVIYSFTLCRLKDSYKNSRVINYVLCWCIVLRIDVLQINL